MNSKERCVVVIGDNNILHYGLFSLIDSACSKKKPDSFIVQGQPEIQYSFSSQISGALSSRRYVPGIR